jgi:hypothetical protein
MRTISILATKEKEQDLDIFDLVHKHRFLLFSVVDILDGLSVLYCFYCMADLSTKKTKDFEKLANVLSYKKHQSK